MPKIIVKINHEVLLSVEETIFKRHINRQMFIKRIAICKIKYGSLKL